eukprot:CAMPEP_0197852430 /NCGR_PEP_ID=MMETSP1438-20131217/20588_1 /TAXON_ID=1461541 /ORGANISM="Pterosperma sp., Strain CCMP1384" /LENGTH=188 /DNA_ID=CAMNT_0043466493 /DNA_START=76 /DNA_END=639 /DNA_ORIENTATION=-
MDWSQTPALGLLGGAAHVLGLVGIFHKKALPLARPPGAKFEQKPDEQTIKLPIRPPILTFWSWGASFAAREVATVASLPAAPISAALGVSPLVAYTGGVALWVASTSLFMRSCIEMNSHKTPVPHGLGVAQKIIDDGLFGILRHPIYIGFMGATLGVGLIFDSLYSLVGLAIISSYLIAHVMPVEEAW